MELANGGNNSNSHYGVEKLVGTNYKYWRMCMEAYLQGQDLWDLVSGADIEIPADTLENSEPRRKWKIKCGKALFALRTSISKEFIDHCFTIEEIDGRNTVAVESTQVQTSLDQEICKDEWIIDSGCSHHVTGNDSLLSEVRQHKGDRVIITADNSAYPVANEGVVKIGILDNNAVQLNDVFHVPGLQRNLISVSQITDSGKYVLFGPKDVKVLDNIKTISADVLTSGERKGSLFVMSAGEAYVKKTSQTESAAVWHARLGHLGYQLLQQISSKKLVDGIPSLQNVREDVICQGCQFGKSHRLPFMNSSNRRSTMLELVHTDLMGSTITPSYSGYHYVMVLVDDFSRYTWVKFLKEKSEALSKFVEFKDAVEKEFGKKIKCLRSDNGGEYMSHDFFHSAQKNGITRQMTCPSTPQQNGVSERKLAHLVSMSLSWLHDKGLPRELWAEAVQCACYVINHLPPWPGNEKSPFEFLYDKKPNVNYFRVFGSTCYVHIPKSNRTKLDPRAKKCIFVGYDTYKKGWRCMDPETKKYVTSRDVVFDEVSFYTTKSTSIQEAILDEDQEHLEMHSENSMEASQNDEGSTSNTSNTVGAEQQALWKSTREKRPPSYLQDYEVQLNHCTTLSCFFIGAIGEEPASYDEAKDYSAWEAAMQEEIEALHKNQTWELVPKPENCKPITCKWVYRLKKKSDGTVDKCKARLVARGFSQSYGLDYEETFSPVAKMVTLRSIFSLAAHKNWKLWQLDVKNAFLYGELDREVFMEQPQGYVSKQFPHHVCQLKKALYGLKQAPRAWYGKVAQYFIFCGFKLSEADSSLFIKRNSHMHLLVLLYVDDMIITGDNEVEISMLKNELSIRFEMKNMGEVGCFLGLEVEKSDQGYFISQKRYAKELLHRFGMGESKEKATPMEPHLKLMKDEGTLLRDATKFRQLVDWAGDANDRHSTSGYCFDTGSAVISWCSKKQNVVSLSSTEAEYVAATMAAQECIWLRSLIGDILCKVEYAVLIKCDNESTVKLASNPIFHARTKHIEVRHHFIREKVLSQEIELQGISTNNQVADIFTKALGKAKFEEFRAALGVVNCVDPQRNFDDVCLLLDLEPRFLWWWTVFVFVFVFLFFLLKSTCRPNSQFAIPPPPPPPPLNKDEPPYHLDRNGNGSGTTDDSRLRLRFRVIAAAASSSSSSSLRPVVILPGLGNNSGDYEKLKVVLEEEQGLPRVVVARVSRPDWLRNAAGLLDPNYWRGTLRPRPVLDWYLDRVHEAVALAIRHTSGCGKISLIGHSAGGWLARLYMEQFGHSHISLLLTLGSPHTPPPKGLPGVIDQTRGLLDYVQIHCARAVYAPDLLRYVCIAGRYVKGNRLFDSFNLNSHFQVPVENYQPISKATFNKTFREDEQTMTEVAIGEEILITRGGAFSGEQNIASISNAIWTRFVGQGYKQVCGQADVWGDGVVPEMSAHLDGALNISLDGVYHSPVGSDDKLRPWYGSPAIVEQWIPHLLS
ncbi:hypothetical protein Syun_017924 [Stephania yunnanensis]|uniref:GPI inositol-deacylase n=1 Tax=Stephania yunnanensis TaxID=152371 RepID=A0AAP0NUJ2_9MAGN